MLEGLWIPFVAISLAEFLDKSQLSLLLLSSKTKNHFHLFLGAMLAFIIVDGVAILLGAWITSLVPISFIRLLSGAFFIIFGILSFRKSHDEEERIISKKSAFLSGFSLIFAAEWGDK